MSARKKIVFVIINPLNQYMRTTLKCNVQSVFDTNFLGHQPTAPILMFKSKTFSAISADDNVIFSKIISPVQES